jgi:hypothetical protein
MAERTRAVDDYPHKPSTPRLMNQWEKMLAEINTLRDEVLSLNAKLVPFLIPEAATHDAALLSLADMLDREADTLADPRSVDIFAREREGRAGVKAVREQYQAKQCNHSVIHLREYAKWVRGFTQLRSNAEPSGDPS